MNTYSIVADPTSATNNGTAIVADGATQVIGGVAPYLTAQWRFPTSTVTTTDKPVQATIEATVTAIGAAPEDLRLLAADFGTTITIADYNLPFSNVDVPAGLLRVPIDDVSAPFIPGSTAAVNEVVNFLIPTRFVDPSLGQTFWDFEVRPSVPTTLSTQSITLAGPGAASAPTKPTLTIITLTLAQLNGPNPYRFPAVGAESLFAFGVEPNEGLATKACNILDPDSIGLSNGARTLSGTGLSSNRVKRRKSAVGSTSAGGSVSFDLTPEKWTPLMLGMFTIVSTTGAGTTESPYVYTFKVASSDQVASFTGVVKKGWMWEVYPGYKLSKLGFSISHDSILKGSIEGMALDTYYYDNNSTGPNNNAILDPSAAYDSVADGVWSFVDGSVTVGTQTGDYVQSFSLDIMNDLATIQGLNGQRGPIAHVPLQADATCSFAMYFENETSLRNFLGDQSSGFPFKAGKKIIFDEVQFTLARQDIPTILQFTMPKGVYETVGDPVQGQGVIVLNVQMAANYDESSMSHITVVLTTLEPPSVFQPNSNVITVLPATPTFVI